MRKKNLHAPQGNVGAILYLDSLDAYKNAFLAEYGKVKSWRKLAKPYKIYPNMARLIANGYNPGNRIREILQLPDKQAVEICEECKKVLTKYHKCKSDPRPPRIAIRQDNPKSAAKSIQNNMEAEVIIELIELLKEKK